MARSFATRCGFKVRILRWPEGAARDLDLCQMAAENPAAVGKRVALMIRSARAFSPFPSPELEFYRFQEQLVREGGESYRKLHTGFARLDAAIGGVHGINILGGTPKAGKSTFFIQVASDMALRHIPVIYYDFENGRQKIYLRILARLARLRTDQIRLGDMDDAGRSRYDQAVQRLEACLRWLRVVNDRKLSPEIMRRHIDFIRNETRADYTVVVVDLIALMKNQVDVIRGFVSEETGVAHFLNSSLNKAQIQEVRSDVLTGGTKLLYVAPESLTKEENEIGRAHV